MEPITMLVSLSSWAECREASLVERLWARDQFYSCKFSTQHYTLLHSTTFQCIVSQHFTVFHCIAQMQAVHFAEVYCAVQCTVCTVQCITRRISQMYTAKADSQMLTAQCLKYEKYECTKKRCTSVTQWSICCIRILDNVHWLVDNTGHILRRHNAHYNLVMHSELAGADLPQLTHL